MYSSYRRQRKNYSEIDETTFSVLGTANSAIIGTLIRLCFLKIQIQILLMLLW